ncbi:co-chaperone protein daf-41 isoform X2 [Cimex lectularius]|uniref:CS domain-containing protein n=1 Tax=Cimex lectularius TaxID=79782 RepID=A0A8I6RVD3_CIMLE|nr:co-chaperone protein daf-41 isoform X2 [Cimex lectularius]
MALATPPAVKWAQRSNVVFLTICLEDCQNPEIKIEPNKVYFKGTGGTDKKLHEVEINLYKEIEPEKCEQAIRGRVIELTLLKKASGDDSESYWPQLTKEKAKHHWLKIDFNRWKDEESSGDDEDGGHDSNYNLSEMMKSMGGLSGSGDSSEGLNMGDLESDSDDEEEFDENLPPLE